MSRVGTREEVFRGEWGDINNTATATNEQARMCAGMKYDMERGGVSMRMSKRDIPRSLEEVLSE